MDRQRLAKPSDKFLAYSLAIFFCFEEFTLHTEHIRIDIWAIFLNTQSPSNKYYIGHVPTYFLAPANEAGYVGVSIDFIQDEMTQNLLTPAGFLQLGSFQHLCF